MPLVTGEVPVKLDHSIFTGTPDAEPFSHSVGIPLQSTRGQP